MTRTDLALHVMQQHELFADLPHDRLQQLSAAGLSRQLSENEYLFREQDPVQACWLVLQGELEALRQGHDGEERIFGQISSTELVGEILQFAPQARFPVSARARCNCLLLQIPRQRMLALCAAEPRVAMRLLAKAGQRLCRRIDEIELMARGSGAQRLACYLLKQYQLQGEEIAMQLNQRQLAATLGLRAETLNRLLSSWQRRGYLQGRRRNWQITDLPALHQLSQASK